MATLDNILALLDRWPLWKRMTEAPARLDELEKKVAALEARLSRAPGQSCPSCGAHEFRVSEDKAHPQFGKLGARIIVRTCGECGHRSEEMKTAT